MQTIIQRMDEKGPTYSTGNYIQYPVINHNGKEDDKEYIWITLPYIRNQHNIVNQLSVQFSCSVASDSLQPHGLQHARLLATSSRSLLKLISVESVMPFNYLVLCPPLLLPLIFPSIRVFSNKSVLCIRWPKYWSFSFSISPSKEYSRLISFRIDYIPINFF